MVDLFGAPSGIIASNELANQNMLSGLKAQEMMGAIAMQPADLALKQAQTRLHGAEAAQKELANEQAVGLLKLDAAFNAEWDARKKLSDAAAGSGAIATVADLTDGSAAKTLSPMSLYTKSQERLHWLEANGAPEQLVAGERDKIATGLEKLGNLQWRQQEAAKSQAEQASKQRQEIGGLAAAAATSEPNYRAIMMGPERARLPKQLTGNYATDVRTLNAIAQASTTAEQQFKLAQKAEEDKVTATRVTAVTARNNASARLARLKADTQEVILANLKKYGGANAEATVEQKRTASAARKAAADAKENAAFPPLPLDPKLHVPGQVYTAADGRRVVAEGVKGQPLRYRVVPSPTAAAVQAAAEASTAEPTTDESADDTGD